VLDAAHWLGTNPMESPFVDVENGTDVVVPPMALKTQYLSIMKFVMTMSETQFVSIGTMIQKEMDESDSQHCMESQAIEVMMTLQML
jgi:hypothetical protein